MQLFDVSTKNVSTMGAAEWWGEGVVEDTNVLKDLLVAYTGHD